MRTYNFAPTIDPTTTADGPDVNLNSSLVKPAVYVMTVLDNVVVSSSSGALFTAAIAATTNGALVTLGGTTAPTGFTFGTTYYAVDAIPGSNTFKLSATPGGSAIAYTDAGTAVTINASFNAGTAEATGYDEDGRQGFQLTPGNTVVVAIQSAADHAGTTITLQGADPSPSDPTVPGSYSALAAVAGVSTATQLFSVVLKQFLRWDVVADASEGSANASITILS